MAKKRLLSGIRPTGALHIGHYLGVLRNWTKLQNEHECFFFIADWHALTTKYEDTSELQKDILEVAKDIISSGIDPNKATIYVQSAVPEVAELHLLLSMITYKHWAEGDPTLKDLVPGIEELENVKKELRALKLTEQDIDFTIKSPLEAKINLAESNLTSIKSGKQPSAWDGEYEVGLSNNPKLFEQYVFLLKKLRTIRQKMEAVTYGLLGYPVLMTADILSVLGEYVPVGKDQVAHLELTRDIARRFNFIYKTNLFPEPEPLLTETPSVPGIDGRKMSKSYGNDIKIIDSEELTKKKVLQMITDPKKIKLSDKGEPNDCQVVYKHYEIFADKKTLTLVQEECRGAKIGCVDCKKRLAEIINKTFLPIRTKRETIKSEKEILEILDSGNKKARQVTRQTLEKVREAMKLRTWS